MPMRVREAPIGVKQCKQCLSSKPLSDFYKQHAKCIACFNANRKEKQAQYRRSRGIPVRPVKNYEVKSTHKPRHGLSAQDIEDILKYQDYQCAVCKKNLNNTKQAIDHDHSCCSGPISCGECVRGILCYRCNLYIGFLERNYDIYDKAIEYLTR
jgi:hypothetical protein